MRDIAVISAAIGPHLQGNPLDTRQIARELGVRYLVVGSIARIGELVQNQCPAGRRRLGRAALGRPLRERVCRSRAARECDHRPHRRSLNFQLVRAEGRRAEKCRSRTRSICGCARPACFSARSRPNTRWRRGSCCNNRSASTPARPKPGRGSAEIIVSDHLNRWNDTGEEQIREAEEAVRKALLIDPSNALAHLANGLIQRARGEHHSALEAFSRAIELDPNFAFAYAHKGNELILVGRPAETPALVEQALRLSPHDPSIGIFHWIARPGAISSPSNTTRRFPGCTDRSRRDRTSGTTGPTWSAPTRCSGSRRRRPERSGGVQSALSAPGLHPGRRQSARSREPEQPTLSWSPPARNSTKGCGRPGWRNVKKMAAIIAVIATVMYAFARVGRSRKR